MMNSTLTGGGYQVSISQNVAPTTTTAEGAEGVENLVQTTVNYTPAASSTKQVFAREDKITVDGPGSIAAGGYATAHQSYIDVTTSGTVDKLVADISKIDFRGTGTVTSAVGYEAVIPTINAGATITGCAGFLFPNLSDVANIGRITTIYSFLCQHYNAVSLNYGRTMKTMNSTGTVTREIAAAYHAGYSASRYYGPRGRSSAVAPYALTQFIVNVVPIHIAERTTFTEIGCRVTTAVAGSNIHLGLYHCVGGTPTSLIVDTGNISSATTGAKTAAISVALEAGMYAAVIACSHAGVSVNGVTLASLTDVFGTVTDNGIDASPYANPGSYIAFPTTFSGLQFADTALTVPFIWLRK